MSSVNRFVGKEEMTNIIPFDQDSLYITDTKFYGLNHRKDESGTFP